MDNANAELPFFLEFGEFKNGYNREEAEEGINDAIRRRRMLRQQSHMKGIMLGTGIGETAKKTVHDGVYKPETTIDVSILPEAQSRPHTDGDESECGSGGRRPCPPLDEMALLRTSPSTLMQEFAAVGAQVETLQEVGDQLGRNIRIARERLTEGCAPYTFEKLLEALTIVVTVVEKGDPEMAVLLPVQHEGSGPLKGAEEVLEFARSNIIPIAVDLSGTIYATEWMLQYTLTFINGITVQAEEEAALHLELRARCVRLLGEINRFTAFAITLMMKYETYAAFDELRQETEFSIGRLLDSVEKDLRTTIQLQFPKRRRRVLRIQRSILSRLYKALSLLHELETGWTPVMLLQERWKNEFLTWSYERIYTTIAPTFLSATLGFIDSSLYVGSTSTVPGGDANGPQLSCSRAPSQHGIVRGKGRDGSPRLQMAPEPHGKQLVLRQVRNFRLREKKTFEQISSLVKGTVNRTVGLQLCLGARYTLQEFGEDQDRMWRFVANEPKGPPDVASYAERLVSKFVGNLLEVGKCEEEMELRCFLAHISSRPGERHVDFPLSPCGTKVPVLGRHSPELYWHLGNNSRLSRRMMTFAVQTIGAETCEDDAHHAPATQIHPQVACCFVLKCLGDCPLTVIRWKTGGGLGTPQSLDESRKTVLYRNDSTVLQVGDLVGIMDKVWMRLILARVCVSETVEEPTVVQEASGGGRATQADLFSTLPTIYTKVPWQQVLPSVRARLIRSILVRKQHPPVLRSGHTIAALSNTQPPLALNGWMEVPSVEPEAAANTCFSENSSNGSGGHASPRVQPCQEDESTCTTVTNAGRKCGTNSSFLGDSFEEKSLLNSLGEVNMHKRGRMSLGDGSFVDNRSTMSVPEVNSYMDTFDERFNEELNHLERRTADTEKLIAGRCTAVGDSSLLALGDTMERMIEASVSTAVSRDQLQMDRRFGERGADILNPAVLFTVSADSQVVYYRH